jgi:hypothetical protein
MPSLPRIAVVVINYNGLDDTHKCLDSLRGVQDENWRALLIDNGSTPPAGDTIAARHGWVEVIQRDTNGGWAGGNNTGIQRALESGAEYVVLLNNDTIVDPQLLQRLRAAAAAGPEYGVLGPVICYMDEPDKVNVDGCVFNDPEEEGFFRRQPVPWNRTSAPQVAETEIVNGCCMMIRADVFEKISLIDERFFLVHEESEFCLRARRAGFRCGILSEPLVWHKGSSFYKRDPRPLQTYYDVRNIALIIRKHRGSPVIGPTPRGVWWKYLKHVYFMYSLHRDRKNLAAANAVLEGLSDALLHRYGPLQPRRRPLVPLLRPLFEMKRRISFSRPAGGDGRGREGTGGDGRGRE